MSSPGETATLVRRTRDWLVRRVHGSRRGLRAARSQIAGFLSRERPLAQDLLVGAVFSIGVGGVFFAVQLGFDARNAERAEVLANVTYIRETIRDGGRMDFRNMNLRGANLSGLDFGCDLKSIGGQLVPVSVEQVYERSDSCATLSGSDLTDARLDDTDLTGAIIEDAIFAPRSARGTVLVGTQLRGTFDVTFEFADLRGAQLRIDSGNSGVLPWPRSRIDVTGSTLVGAMVSDQDPSGDIYHADISLTHSRVAGIHDYRPDVGSGRAIDDWGDTWDPDPCASRYWGDYCGEPLGRDLDWDGLPTVNGHASSETMSTWAVAVYESIGI